MVLHTPMILSVLVAPMRADLSEMSRIDDHGEKAQSSRRFSLQANAEKLQKPGSRQSDLKPL